LKKNRYNFFQQLGERLLYLVSSRD